MPERSPADVVRAANEAFNGGELGALGALYDDDVEIRDLQHAPDQPEVVRGRAAVSALAEGWAEQFSELKVDLAEVAEVGEHVVCVTRWHGSGVSSGAQIELRGADIHTVRDGVIVASVLGFRTREAAMASLRPPIVENHRRP